MIALHNVAAQIVAQLASFEMSEGSAYISTPLIYPGGATVIVRVDQVGGRFVASDAGLGHREAHMLGGDRIFGRLAGEIAVRFGVSCDGIAMFVVDADADNITSAVIAVANASRTAVEQTAYRVAERAKHDAREMLRYRLVSLFGNLVSTSAVRFRGASNDEWDFDAAVQREDRTVLFEAVAPHAASVASAVTKFVDLSDLPAHPRLVAVLSEPERTPHRRLIERSAETISLEASDTVWQRAAA